MSSPSPACPWNMNDQPNQHCLFPHLLARELAFDANDANDAVNDIAALDEAWQPMESAPSVEDVTSLWLARAEQPQSIYTLDEMKHAAATHSSVDNDDVHHLFSLVPFLSTHTHGAWVAAWRLTWPPATENTSQIWLVVHWRTFTSDSTGPSGPTETMEWLMVYRVAAADPTLLRVPHGPFAVLCELQSNHGHPLGALLYPWQVAVVGFARHHHFSVVVQFAASALWLVAWQHLRGYCGGAADCAVLGTEGVDERRVAQASGSETHMDLAYVHRFAAAAWQPGFTFRHADLDWKQSQSQSQPASASSALVWRTAVEFKSVRREHRVAAEAVFEVDGKRQGAWKRAMSHAVSPLQVHQHPLCSFVSVSSASSTTATATASVSASNETLVPMGIIALDGRASDANTLWNAMDPPVETVSMMALEMGGLLISMAAPLHWCARSMPQPSHCDLLVPETPVGADVPDQPMSEPVASSAASSAPSSAPSALLLPSPPVLQ